MKDQVAKRILDNADTFQKMVHYILAHPEAPFKEAAIHIRPDDEAFSKDRGMAYAFKQLLDKFNASILCMFAHSFQGNVDSLRVQKELEHENDPVEVCAFQSHVDCFSWRKRAMMRMPT
jgi:hypothetical protein